MEDKGRSLPTHDSMTGLMRGSEYGWCLVCLVGEGKTLMRLEGMGKGVLQMAFRSLTQACNSISEQTYPGPLLVNIKLLYPHRE